MRTRLAAVAATATLTVTGLLGATPAGAADSAVKQTTAKALLAKLTVAAEPTSHTGFPGSLEAKWAKSTVKGCKTVKEQVIAQEALDPAPNNCTPYNRIMWLDPWLGNKTQTASVMRVERLVQTGEAWESGAALWDAKTQAAYGSDVGYYGTLVAVTLKAINERDQAEPQEWLPAKKALRCAYVTEWISVKYRWKLSIDDAEHHALTAALAKCPVVKFKPPKQAKITAAA